MQTATLIWDDNTAYDGEQIVASVSRSSFRGRHLWYAWVGESKHTGVEPTVERARKAAERCIERGGRVFAD